MKLISTLCVSLALAFSCAIKASCPCCQPQDYTFYIKASSGISCSESARVDAPPPTWNPAVQGYNSKLGNQGIAGLGLGCEFMRWIDAELSVSARSTFKYRKFQTPTAGGDSYTREFDLDVIPRAIA